jgi:hypothetical protein
VIFDTFRRFADRDRHTMRFRFFTLVAQEHFCYVETIFRVFRACDGLVVVFILTK